MKLNINTLQPVNNKVFKTSTKQAKQAKLKQAAKVQDLHIQILNQ